MKLRIEASSIGKYRKAVTFDVSDETAKEFIQIFHERNNGENDRVAIDGNMKAVKIKMTILQSETDC